MPAGASQPDAGETDAGHVEALVVAQSMEMPPKAEFSDEDKALLEEARLAQLATDDPAAYEQEMIDALQNS